VSDSRTNSSVGGGADMVGSNWEVIRSDAMRRGVNPRDIASEVSQAVHL